MSVALKPKQPKYAQLQEHLARQIRRGELVPGDRLPTFAEMREEFGATPTTVQRVYSALELEGFITRENGRGTFVAQPKARKTGLIGLVSGVACDAVTPPYWMDLMNGARQAAEAQGQHLVMMRDDPQSGVWQQIEGVILAGLHPARLDRLTNVRVPMVSVLSRAAEVPAVVADEAQGIRDAIQHLLFLGHRRIAYLATMETKSDDIYLGRQKAYREGLREAGIAEDTRWMRALVNHDRDGQPLVEFFDKAQYVMQCWLQEDWRELGCTALLTYNDEAALGAISVLKIAGLRVPEEVSVIGFDGTRVSDFATPQLTTVEVPLQAMGARATELLLQQIAGKESDRPPRALPTKLRVRASTAPVRQF